jgi:hypothetical protein
VSAEIRRIITTQDRKVAKNTKKAYLRKKESDGLTQKKLGKQVGMEATTVSQYLNCIAPMSLNVILKFADALGVAAKELDSEIEKRFKIKAATRGITFPVLGTLSGTFTTKRSVMVKGMKMENHDFAIIVDTSNYGDFLEQNSTLIINPTALIKPNDRVVVKFKANEQYHPVRLVEITETHAKLKRIGEDGTLDKFSDFQPKRARKIPLKDISAIYKIRGIQYN